MSGSGGGIEDDIRDSWQVSGVTLATGMPDDVVQAMKLDARCAVIALTHDPKPDDLALMEALRSDAFYVGAIGSRLNNQRRCERLAELTAVKNAVALPHRVGIETGKALVGLAATGEVCATPARLAT